MTPMCHTVVRLHYQYTEEADEVGRRKEDCQLLKIPTNWY
jgi:hypothetical protein